MTLSGDQPSTETPRALRVCFISHQYPPDVIGGIGRFTADLARGFSVAGHDVHVLTTQGGVCMATRQNGVWIHRLPSSPAIPRFIRSDYSGLHLARMGCVYREIVRLHQEQPIDIISCPIWLAEGLLVAMDPRFVSVLSLHTSSKTGLDLQSASLGTDPLTELERLCVRAHAYTHANSHAAVNKITDEYGPPTGVVVIPHGVNDRSELIRRSREEDGRVRVLLVGLLDKRKGADALYEIIPAVLARFPNVEFMLVGQETAIAELQNQTLSAALKARLAGSPDTLSRVEFAGVVSDRELNEAYANADILLLPSRFESFGLTVVEAMSFGLPVVAWKAGGVCETIVDGETGILVEVDDCPGIVEAVGRLAADSALRKRFGKAGRRRYLAHFSTAVSVPRTIETYRAIVDRSASTAKPHGSFDVNDLASKIAGVVEATTVAKGDAALETARLLIAGDGSDQPRVGVILRCFNSSAYVVSALESVFAQTYQNFRCVVIDDASSDGSAFLVSSWLFEKKDNRFSLVGNERSLGWMACIAAGRDAGDEFVAFLDGADLWSPDFLETHVGVIRSRVVHLSCSDRVGIDPNGQMSGGALFSPAYQQRKRRFSRRLQSIGGNLSESGPPNVSRLPPTYLRSMPRRIASSMVVRRSLLDAVLPSDPQNFQVGVHEHILLLCHFLAGSYVIDRGLSACHCETEKSLSPIAAFAAEATAYSAPKRHADDLVVARQVARHLLDYPPQLATVLPARGRQVLLRKLVRTCLLAGVSIEDARLNDALGRARLLRDRLRAKVWFLRSQLDS